MFNAINDPCLTGVCMKPGAARLFSRSYNELRHPAVLRTTTPCSVGGRLLVNMPVKQLMCHGRRLRACTHGWLVAVNTLRYQHSHLPAHAMHRRDSTAPEHLPGASQRVASAVGDGVSGPRDAPHSQPAHDDESRPGGQPRRPSMSVQGDTWGLAELGEPALRRPPTSTGAVGWNHVRHQLSPWRTPMVTWIAWARLAPGGVVSTRPPIDPARTIARSPERTSSDEHTHPRKRRRRPTAARRACEQVHES